MIKTALIFCILLLSHQALGDFNFNSVVSVSQGNDVVRSYGYVQGLLGGFTLFGVSQDGTLTKNSANFSVDTSIFRYDTGNLGGFPSLTWLYFHGSLNIANLTAGIDASAFASAYIPTFIVEYVETNDKEGFQIGGDQVVGFVNLGGLVYTTTKESETVDGTDSTAYHISSTSLGGLFQMNFTVSGHPVEVDGNRISSEQAKIDIGINGYYDPKINVATKVGCLISDATCVSTGPSDNSNSRLAITSFFIASNFELDVDGEVVNVDNNDGFDAGFSWVGEAQVSASNGAVSVNVHSNVTDYNGGDYTSADVTAVISGKTQQKFIIYSFDSVRPDSVSWDPTLGASANNAFKVVSSFGFVLVFVLFALLL